METAIAIEGLQKNIAVGFLGRPKRLLHDVTLQVQSGAVFGFIGQNGAGKSTTIKHLVGVMKPSAGSVQIFGNAPQATAARKSIGYLPEMPRLPANLMPLELLEHHARLLGIPVGDRKTSIENLVHDVDILRFCNQRVRTLSKGNQQRVALALALLGNPKLLILDEPMSGLDLSGRKLVRNLIRREQNRGATVFLSSHVLSDVESLCDEVAILHEGEILLQGSVSSVLHGHDDSWVLSFAGTPTEQMIHTAGDSLTCIDNNLHKWRFRDATHAWNQAAALRTQGFDVRELTMESPSLEDRVLQILQHADRAENLGTAPPVFSSSSTEGS